MSLMPLLNVGGVMPFARPFYDDTEERLLKTNDHVESMRQGLKNRGYKVK